MQGSEIFLPFFGMFLLTFAVWVLMYVRRLAFIARNKIDTQKLRTPEMGAALVPEAVSYPSYNFKNLFELPVIFYALCLYLYVIGSVDHTYVISAWIFFTFRALHSAIHCTVNIVKLRFLSYLIAALALWSMLFRAVLDLLPSVSA